MQTTVRDLLKLKTQPLKFVREHDSVFEAVEELIAHMTRNVIYVRPDQTIEECMELMTERRIRNFR